MSKSCRGKPRSEPSFIVMLFDYTQVKWKVYLHPMKITFSLKIEKKRKRNLVDFYLAMAREDRR